MLRSGFMLGFFEGCVADKDLAVLAPIPGLSQRLVKRASFIGDPDAVALTADFQYSAISASIR